VVSWLLHTQGKTTILCRDSEPRRTPVVYDGGGFGSVAAMVLPAQPRLGSCRAWLCRPIPATSRWSQICKSASRAAKLGAASALLVKLPQNQALSKRPASVQQAANPPAEGRNTCTYTKARSTSPNLAPSSCLRLSAARSQPDRCARCCGPTSLALAPGGSSQTPRNEWLWSRNTLCGLAHRGRP
jgi:hypothetical protein